MEKGLDLDCRFYIIIQSLIMDHMDGHDAFYVWLIFYYVYKNGMLWYLIF